MKVYMVMKRDGTIFEPVYLTKAEATKLRNNPSMPPKAQTFVKTLIVATSK